MRFDSLVAACAGVLAVSATAIPQRRPSNEYKLRVTSGGPPLAAQYLSVRNSTLGIYPNQSPVIVSIVPSCTHPDRISLRPIPTAGVDRAIALVGTIGVLDLVEIDLPADNTPQNSWGDFTIEAVGGQDVLRWAAAKTVKSRPWLAMPMGSSGNGYDVWYVDDFQGGFGGVVLPIDNIVLEQLAAN